MKRIYHFYLTCMTLTLTMPMMIVSAFAVDDMWTVANNIIVDVYGKTNHHGQTTGTEYIGGRL